ncbi:hypothetical protein P9112_007521 [Eukaryota sp. TZLM1-RC]
MIIETSPPAEEAYILYLQFKTSNSTLSKYYLHKSAELGHPEACLALSIHFKRVRNVPQYIFYLRKSADLHNPQACSQLASIYHKGSFLPTNHTLSLHYYSLAAANHCIESNYLCGVFFKKGIGCDQDLKKSFSYFSFSGSFGHVPSLFNLGLYFYKGIGTKKDYSKSFDYFQLVFNSNSKLKNYSSFYLGVFYFKGIFVNVDYDLAYNYFELASNSIPRAFYFLGYLDITAKKRQLDSTKAAFHLSKGREKGCIYCEFLLGLGQLRGVFPNSNSDLAFDLIKNSAENNISQAIPLLADLYFQKGIYDLSLDLFLSSTHYCKLSLFRVGQFYFHGLDCQTNYQQAFEFFKSAAEFNIHHAFLYLGVIYEKGLGTTIDLSLSLKFYNLAVQNKCHAACLRLACLLFNMNNFSPIPSLLKTAQSISNSSMSNYFESMVYFKGIGVENDYHKGIIKLKHAADSGHCEASFLVGKMLENIKEFKQSQRYYEQAVVKGHVDASYRLALLIEDSYRILSLLHYAATRKHVLAMKALAERTNQESESFSWYLQAANGGNVDSMVHVANCYFKGKGVACDDELGAYYCERASPSNDHAKFMFAECLLNGVGVEKNVTKACKLLKILSDKDHLQAKRILAKCYLEGIGVEKDEVMGLTLSSESIVLQSSEL